MKNAMSILFYLKRTKVNAAGSCPIYTRVTIAGKRLEFSTTKFVDPSKWSLEGYKVKGIGEEARSINNHLDLLKNQVVESETRLFRRGVQKH